LPLGQDQCRCPLTFERNPNHLQTGDSIILDVDDQEDGHHEDLSSKIPYNSHPWHGSEELTFLQESLIVENSEAIDAKNNSL
jgi:hypothetical protein